ncbi:MAG: LPS export ABC transporter periplasmic protein LptC [Mariprofundus sp.]
MDEHSTGMKKKIWRSLKWGSLVVSVASIALAIILMRMSGPKEISSSQTDAGKSKTRVESPVIVERKDGNITWQLRASEANQQLNGKMHLINPVLVLYTEGGQKINIESDQAWFEPLQRNVRFKHHVVVHYNDWTMWTGVMVYLSDRDEIHVPGKFRVQGNSIKARGKNMSFHRSTEVIEVEDGIWIEDADPNWQGVLSK